MKYSDALEIVHELATKNSVDATDVAFGGGDMEGAKDRQTRALNTLGDLIDNHHEEIDDRYQAPAEVSPIPAEALAAEGELDPDMPLDSIRICLDWASHVAGTEEEKHAVALVENFIVRHGDDLKASMTTFTLPRH